MPTHWLDPTTPADLDTIEVLWPEAGQIMNVDALVLILASARNECVAFAPTLAAGEAMPEGWPVAQVMQARNKYNAALAAGSPDGTFDGSSYGLTAHPLDWQVMQLLRPRRAMGAIV
ncbi:hypothetical protein [Microbacterium candidum]|uniref:Phage gp6-like head-tail connector protein n=1 Tax=Microbacterium candidum TaxID=3041922 RepID=A0ABT7MWL5_9MICO|nr:hypothetical protein [Microbacterium sp. ASV49]MDL9978846.1 hypothetical protein [Microbacterium sp. ASV49]